MSAKPILEVRAVVFEKKDTREYELKLKSLYETHTNNEYHVIVLFDEFNSIAINDRIKYPILRVL